MNHWGWLVRRFGSGLQRGGLAPVAFPVILALHLGKGPSLAAEEPTAREERPAPPPPEQRERGPGPWDQDLLVYKVHTNGATERVAVFERGGVATLTRLRDGRLIAAHQYFPRNDPAAFDKVAVRFSADEGRTWSEPEVIKLQGLPEGMRFPFDPTLVPLPDGRVRLYFTSVKLQGMDEHGPAIYSAISTNGIDYRVEPGIRFGVEGRKVIDCAVALHNGIFHLYAPDNGAAQRRRGGPPPQQPPPEPGAIGVGYHATSRDGLRFKRQEDVRIEGRRRWLGNAQSDGQVITFYGTGEGGVWTASSADGARWKVGVSIRIAAADPGAVTLRDGSVLVLGTGPPRPGTPSAEGRRR